MPWELWLLFAFVVVVGIAGAVHLVREGLSLWRSFRSLNGLLGRAAVVLGERADAAARKAGATGEASERLAASVDRLSRSIAYARVVADAGGVALAALAILRGRIPTK